MNVEQGFANDGVHSIGTNDEVIGVLFAVLKEGRPRIEIQSL